MGRKLEGAVHLFRRGVGSPSNTMWPRPTSVPSFILMHPTVWPKYTNVTDWTDRQWSGSTGRTILQTVSQKPIQLGRDLHIVSVTSTATHQKSSVTWYEP